MVVRHTRPSQRNPEGGRLNQEASIHISNVMPIDADSDKPTRIHVTVDEESGQKKRVAKSGAELKQG
jgi:large subunit ribosomal protein L24